jgi:site-specific DNA recombinase
MSGLFARLNGNENLEDVKPSEVTIAVQGHELIAHITGSSALRIGKLYDDRGNRITPSHANKAGRRYRYYVSCALSQGRSEEAGSGRRVSAAAIEARVIAAPRDHFPQMAERDDRALVAGCVERAVI